MAVYLKTAYAELPQGRGLIPPLTVIRRSVWCRVGVQQTQRSDDSVRPDVHEELRVPPAAGKPLGRDPAVPRAESPSEPLSARLSKHRSWIRLHREVSGATAYDGLRRVRPAALVGDFRDHRNATSLWV